MVSSALGGRATARPGPTQLMHEVGIMQSILAVAEQQARAAGAVRIHQVRVRIGQLAGVVPDSLQCAFEILRPPTLAAAARLEIEEIPPTCWCAVCQREFASPELWWQCPQCGAASNELRRGRELELASLEVE